MDKKQKRVGLLFKDTAIFAIGSLGSKLLTFLLVPLYTKVLTTAEYGTANLLFTTITVLYPLFTLAISEGALRFAIEKKDTRNEVLTVALLFNLIGILLLLASYPIILSFGDLLKNYWWLFVAYYAGVSFHESLSQYLKGIGKTKWFAISGIIHTALLITLNIVFLLGFRMGLTGYLLASIIGYWGTNLFIVICGGLMKYFAKLRFDRSLAKEMLYYSFPMIPTIIAWWANSAIDKYVITAIEGVASNGVFSIAGKIPSILSIVTSLFSQAFQLSAISSYEDDDFEDYFNKVFYGFFVVSIVSTTLLVILNKFLCYILFAGEFFKAWVFVPFLLLANLFSSMSGILASAFRAKKKNKNLFVSTLIGAVANLILNIILIKRIGTIGASLATLISFFVVWAIRMISVQKLVKVRLPWIRFITSVVLSLLCCVVFVLELKYDYVISVVLLIAICFINLSELRNLLSKAWLFVAKFFNKMRKKVGNG